MPYLIYLQTENSNLMERVQRLGSPRQHLAARAF